MITLRSVQLKNFLSHEDTTIDFKDNSKLLIDGKSGSGKSAIVDAIVWCFYGRARADNKSLIKYGKKMASVTVFTGGGKKYKITRTITDKKHDVVITDDETHELVKTKGLREANEYIEKEILHSSYALFVNSVVYPQGGSENFLQQTAAKKKDMIMEIVNAGSYEDYHTKIKRQIQIREIDMKVHEGRMVSARDNLKEYEEAARKKDVLEKEVIDLDNKIYVIKDAIKCCREKLNEYDRKTARGKDIVDILKEKERHVLSVQGNLAYLKKRLTTLESINYDFLRGKIEELEETLAEMNEEEKKVSAQHAWSYKMLVLLREKPNEIDFNSLIEQQKQELEEANNCAVEMCQEIGRLCPLAEFHKLEGIKSKEDHIAWYEGKKMAQKNALDEYNQKVVALGEEPQYSPSLILELNKKIKELEKHELEYIKKEENEKEIIQIRKQVKELGGDVTLTSAEINQLEKEREMIIKDVSTSYTVIEQLAVKEEELIAEEEILSHKNYLLFMAKDAEKRIIDLKKTISDLTKSRDVLTEEINNLELLKGAFGQGGIKALIIDYVIPRLEDKINNILGQLSGFTVKLDTQKSGVGENVILEGLFITIVNEEGEELDYNNYSGGEKLKIEVAITEALAELQKASFRILDELFIGLDDESIENFSTVLSSLQGRFNQLICISHLRTIKDMFHEVITVVKPYGTSKIYEEKTENIITVS